MAKQNNKSQVFVRTFVAGTIALSLVSAPSLIMADEVVSTPAVNDVTPVTQDAPVVATEDAKEVVDTDVASADNQSADNPTSQDEPVYEYEIPPALTNARDLDAYSLAEIVAGTRTLDNGTLDLRIFNNEGALQIGRDSDNDGINDEDEIIVYELGGEKHYKYLSDPLKADSDGDGIIDSEDKNKLSWDFSPRDAYIFSKLSYREDEDLNKIFTYDQGTVEQAFEVLDEKNKTNVPEVVAVDLGNKTMIAAQRELARYWRPVLTLHEASGLDAVLFEFNSDLYPYLKHKSNYVLAFRGTDQSGDGDKSDDAWLGAGKFTNQGQDIVKYNKDLRNKTGRFADFNIKNLNVTGHSLGGYLSQVFLADMQGGTVGTYKTPLSTSDIVKDVYTFNAAPIIVRSGFFVSSPQNVRDLKDAGDKLNEAHKYDPENPNEGATHRHFVIDGEAVTAFTGGFKNHEEIGKIVSDVEGDVPTSGQAHYLSNFAREQYSHIFNEGIRQGFSETEILPLLTGIDGYTEVDFIGKVKPYTLTVKNADGEVFLTKIYTQKGFNAEIERLNNTGRYTAQVELQGATYTLKKAPVYSIIDTDGKVASDLVYTVNEDTQGVFVSDAPATLLMHVELDGKIMPLSSYTVEAGSTIVRVNKDTMDKLANGEHTIAMVYTDGGKAESKFMVEGHAKAEVGESKEENDSKASSSKPSNQMTQKKGTAQTPATSDVSGFASGLMALAGSAIAFVSRKRD